MKPRRIQLGAISLGLAIVVGGCAGAPRKGLPWTIVCLEATEPDHVIRLERIATTLRQTPGIRPADVRVTHGADGAAVLHYGVYPRRRDRKTRKLSESPAMRRDLRVVRELVDNSNHRFFARARTAPMPLADVGNPAWSLTNVEATYTLQVAVFEPTEKVWNYKEIASKYCGELRALGFEAYYFHGNASSMVTVGAFGPDALVRRADGHTYYSRDVRTLRENDLLKYNLVNGGICRARNDEGQMVAVLSSLVLVPENAGGWMP